MSRQDRATTERHARILRELVKRPENKLCADCKRNDPRWASWNMSASLLSNPNVLVLIAPSSGVFLCIRCSGIHRGMGTHISRVKSIDLDTWTVEQMDVSHSFRPPLTHSLTHSFFSSPYRNGAIVAQICIGKHISSLATVHPISQ